MIAKITMNHLVLSFYGIIASLMIIMPLLTPRYNWDMLAYAACSKGFEIDDKIALHKNVFDELAIFVPQKAQGFFISGNEYVDKMHQDAEAFNQQLPFYKIRFIYNFIIYSLEKVGVNPYLAMQLISGISSATGLLLLFFAFRKYIDNYLLFLLPLISFPLGYLFITRIGTPDSFTFAVTALMIFIYMKKSHSLFLFIPLSVLVRTDLIIFSTLLLLGIIFFTESKRERLFAVLSFIVMFIAYVAVNKYSGNYGYTTIFYFTLMGTFNYPAEQHIIFQLSDYIKVFLRGIIESWNDRSFNIYLFILSLVGYLILKNNNNKTSIFNQINYRITLLFSVSSLYILFHFLLFPVMWERYFVAEYMMGVITLFVLLSNKPIHSNDATLVV
jgi:hypothetical protein